MKLYKHEDVDKYLENDWILEWIKQYEKEEEKAIRTHQWMLEMENKRAIYADVYGDILRADIDLNAEVLDVGGGYNALTKLLANNCRYTLVDFMAHGRKCSWSIPGG